MKISPQLTAYSKNMSQAKLPRWEELPEIPLYCDQMLQFVHDKLAFLQSDDDKPITKSMVNNYVKWGIMPKPESKKYHRSHISYMITIAILKKIISINQIKNGINLQVYLQGNEAAYNSFCTAFEGAMQTIFQPLLDKNDKYLVKSKECVYDELAINALAKTLANKLLALKIISIEMNRHPVPQKKKGKTNEEE